jgi:hypothetical protein
MRVPGVLAVKVTLSDPQNEAPICASPGQPLRQMQMSIFASSAQPTNGKNQMPRLPLN